MITVPQNSFNSLKSCLLALATNDNIQEITICKMNIESNYPIYEMSWLLSKTNLKTLNLDC